MPELYLTPSALSYFAQFLLLFVLSIYLIWRYFNHQEDAQFFSFIGFIVGLTAFSLLLFLETASLPTPRLYFVYLQNTILALSLLALYDFIYRFPAKYEQRKWERRGFFVISLFYAGYEIYYAIHRFSGLIEGNVNYRIGYEDYILGALFALIPFLLARQALCADSSSRFWLAKLWQPANRQISAGRSLALIAFFPLLLGIANILRAQSAISTTYFNIALSLGILAALFLLVLFYLNSLQESTSIFDKIVGTTLTLLFIILGATGWMLTPQFLNSLHTSSSEMVEAYSLRFTPNGDGYAVTKIPFIFENNLGQELPITTRGQERNYGLDFSFPFFGTTYERIYVTSVGLMRMGEELYHPNLQYHYGRIPAIFPLLIDLQPEGPGGVFARTQADRLIITWNEISPLYHPGIFLTFQVILYQDGRFDFNYKDIPTSFVFQPDSNPSSNLWLRGATPGISSSAQLVKDLSDMGKVGPSGALQDFNLEFRQKLHQFLLPLFWVIIFSGVVIFLLMPFLLYRSIGLPLNALMSGVQQVESGNLGMIIYAQGKDEIGDLSRSFNTMTALLKKQMDDLEKRVDERTNDLAQANQALQAEIVSRQAAQAELIAKERSLAIVNEREHLSRELHDGLAQITNTIGLQIQTAQTFMERGEANTAYANLDRAFELARDANTEIRQFILGLRDNVEPHKKSFWNALHVYIDEYKRMTGVEPTLCLPAYDTLPDINPAVEHHLLHIIKEALMNIVKHAQAKQVDIFLGVDSRSLVVTISDDGLGFRPPNSFDKSGLHFGLSMMYERAKNIGGRIQLVSRPGYGTKVFLFVPIQSGVLAGDVKGLSSIRLLLVDDSTIFLEGLRSLLMARGISVVDTASNGREAIEKVARLRPDMVIMDVFMPVMDGVQATFAIKRDFPETRVLMLTTSENDEHLFSALKYGVSGFLLKGIDADEFCSALERVAQGDVILSPSLATRILTEFSTRNTVETAGQLLASGHLSPIQLQVLELVANRVRYSEIATRLYLSEATVKYHVKQILNHLQLENRAELITHYKKHNKPGEG